MERRGVMGIKTSVEYIESLKKMNPEVYVGGARIDHVVGNKYFRISLEEMCKFYDWANDPEKEEDFVFWSSLVNEKVSFWTHLRQSPEEVQKIIETLKKNNARHFCSMCMITGLNVLWAVTYDIDQARGTDYHRRLQNFFRELQKNDLRYCMGVMDPKGDRSLPPSARRTRISTCVWWTGTRTESSSTAPRCTPPMRLSPTTSYLSIGRSSGGR
jgi:4-hydroxybutyryl-CoA dehydratase/vinylacetyl-CoA-Delta-isomerase